MALSVISVLECHHLPTHGRSLQALTLNNRPRVVVRLSPRNPTPPASLLHPQTNAGTHVTSATSQPTPPVTDTAIPPPNNQRTAAVRPQQRIARTRSQQKAGLSPLFTGLEYSKKAKESGKTPRPNAKGPPGGQKPAPKGRKDEKGPDFHGGKAD